MPTIIAIPVAWGLMVAMLRAGHALALSLGPQLPGVGGVAVFWAHTALVAVAAGLGLLLAVRLMPRALPTAVAVGVMGLAVVPIAVTLIASGGRMGIEAGVWFYDLMPMALGLFFGRAIARDRLRAGAGERS